jgi:tetratricopeptide (TPR) repeat protein
MVYIVNKFFREMSSAVKSIILIAIFLCLSVSISNAQIYNLRKQKLRTKETVGTVTVVYYSKNTCYTKISYLGAVLRLDYITRAYGVGDKLMIAYDPYDIYNAAPILEKPYFEKGELTDTTEGVLRISSDYMCTIGYKTYGSSDSLDLIMENKNRYLSPGMFDTLVIKPNFVYKIIYNKKSEKAEVLFNAIIDSTHEKLNKHLFSALQRITDGNPIDAIGDLNECILLDPKNDYYYYFHRGKAQENLREYKNAAEDFTRYIDLKPKDKRGYVRRATVYIQMAHLEAAQKDVTELFFLNSQDPEACYLQGVIYYHKKEYQKAISYYSTAISYSNGSNREIYYYDRAKAREKLYGKKDKECRKDYNMAKKEAIKNQERKLHGNHTHQEELHRDKHNFYCTLTSDNTLAFNPAIGSNMQTELILPYTANNAPVVFDKTISLNNSKHSTSFSLGLFSLELGGFKRMYVRTETAITLNNGTGTPWNFRTVLGYNIKFTKKDVAIFRPEMGFTYFGRAIQMGDINFNGATQMNIMGTTFNYYTDKNEHHDQVKTTFHENVLSLSPALGLWLWPYSSKFVMRVGIGYNYVLSQNYSVYFQSNKEHLREQLGNLNTQYSNTNGKTTNFFSYNGFFINVGIGIRF